MIRLPFRHSHSDDAPDPELTAIFSAGGRAPAIDAARLERGRTLIAARLRPEPAAGGWFRRRLAYGAAGGGGLWASVVGVAAANKAATAVGIGVLLATGATAEVSGIGPAVRDAVSGGPSAAAPTTEPTLEGVATAEATVNEDAPGDNDNNNGAVVTDAPDGIPGNLTTHLRSDGSFSLRGLLIDVNGDLIQVRTSLDDVPLQFAVGDATLRLPGAGNPQGGPRADEPRPTLEDFEGHLIRVTGTCDTVEGQLTEDCTLESVNVLGNAGQHEPAAVPDGQRDQPGNGQGNGPPAETGKPAHPGKPADTPGNGPGGNGNKKAD